MKVAVEDELGLPFGMAVARLAIARSRSVSQYKDMFESGSVFESGSDRCIGRVVRD